VKLNLGITEITELNIIENPVILSMIILNPGGAG
jgi:hypothetical protein